METSFLEALRSWALDMTCFTICNAQCMLNRDLTMKRELVLSSI